MSTETSLNTSQLRAQGWNTDAPSTAQVKGGGYVLMEGHAGEGVGKMQERLAELGYPVAEKGKDGRDLKFGNDSRLALEEFQRRNGLVDKDGRPDGKLGEQTYKKLFDSTDPVRGPGIIVRDSVKGSVKRSSAESDRLRAATTKAAKVTVDAGAQKQYEAGAAVLRSQDLRANPDAKPIFDGSTTGPRVKEADLSFGAGTGMTLRDSRGEVVAKGADYVTAGGRGNVSLIEGKGTMDLGAKFGGDVKGGLELSGELGVTGAAKRNADGKLVAVSGRAGAYAGADAVGEANFSARYFGAGIKRSVGVGAGAQVEGHAQVDDDRLSVSAFGRAATLGIIPSPTVGIGAQFWFDTAQVKKDYNAASKWAGETTDWVGAKVSSAWNSIDWKPNDARP